jgi:hypothetical protein
MRPSFRRFLCWAPLTLAAATLYLLAHAGLGQLYLRPLKGPRPPTAPDRIREEEIRWADRRWEAKRQVTGALLDGRLTLRQAAARFRAIDADLPLKARAQRPPEYTEEEWACRQVIAFVEGELAGLRQAPAQAREWGDRLEAELQEHLRHAAAAGGHRPRRPRRAHKAAPGDRLDVLVNNAASTRTRASPS